MVYISQIDLHTRGEVAKVKAQSSKVPVKVNSENPEEFDMAWTYT